MTPREFAIELYNKAQGLVQTDPRMAYQMYTSAVAADPLFADGWSMLGAALADLGTLSASCAAYRTALRLPDSSDVGGMTPALRHRCLLQLGHRLTHQRVVSWRSLDEAEAALRECLAMGADKDPAINAFCYTNLSLIASHRGDKEAELHYAEKGFELNPDPSTELGLAFACLFQGQYARGIKHFEARFPFQLPSYLSLPFPRWDGEYVETLQIISEQGAGDALSFSRFIPDAAARVGKVVFPVQPVLMSLLSERFKDISNVEIMPQERQIEYADAWCPIFSLPIALGMDDEQIRARKFHIPVRPVENTSWKDKNARLHVAIAWAGAAANGIDFHRTIPFTEFLQLREIPGIALYSVQVGDRAKEMHDSGCTAFARDMAPWIHDAKDTAGILSEMDLTISCESFVGHLAGAIGAKCYVACSRMGRDWRSSPHLGDRPLWYDKHRLFRQGDDCRWGPVFRRIVEALS